MMGYARWIFHLLLIITVGALLVNGGSPPPKIDNIDCGSHCSCFNKSTYIEVFDDWSEAANASLANGTDALPLNHTYELAPGSVTTYVDCRSRNLGEIPASALVQYAQIFQMSHNRLTHLPGRRLENCTRVFSLELGYNRISRIEADAFVGLQNLGFLRLNNNNLSAVPAGVFDGLSSLMILDLSFNNFKRIPNIKSLISLNFVRMAHNRIEEVGADDFPGEMKTSPINIDIRVNSVESFPHSLAARMEQLDAESYFEVILVGGNPWVCDCRMLDLKKVWPMHPRYLADSFYCDSPDKLNGENIWHIPNSEFVCENATREDRENVKAVVQYNKIQLIGACVGFFVFGVVVILMAYFGVVLLKKGRGDLAGPDGPFVRMEDTVHVS